MAVPVSVVTAVNRLPHPVDFYAAEGIKLLGTGGCRHGDAWRELRRARRDPKDADGGPA
jgi:hypothetical protein